MPTGFNEKPSPSKSPGKKKGKNIQRLNKLFNKTMNQNAPNYEQTPYGNNSGFYGNEREMIIRHTHKNTGGNKGNKGRNNRGKKKGKNGQYFDLSRSTSRSIESGNRPQRAIAGGNKMENYGG